MDGISQETYEQYKSYPLRILKKFLSKNFFNEKGKELIRKIIKEKERKE